MWGEPDASSGLWGNQRGALALEWLVAVSLVAVLATLSATAMVASLRRGMSVLVHVEGGAAAQAATNVLRSELSRAAPGLDWTAPSGDSLRIRAVRGTAWICGVLGTGGRVTVVYRGDRTPNPAKDSVRILSADGSVEVRGLRARRTRARCPHTGLPADEWDLGPSPPQEAVLRLFESGTYAMDRGALRYRTGRGGRQPVAGVAFDSASSLTWQAASGVPFGGVASHIALPPGPYRSQPQKHDAVLLGRRTLP